MSAAGDRAPRSLRLVASLAALWLCAHAEAEDFGRRDEIIGRLNSVASVHYCACGGWPETWAELRAFGEAALPRVVRWEDLAASGTWIDRSGHLKVDLRCADPPIALRVGFVVPDCSDSHPGGLAHHCRERR
jgi:hypothetical protein